MASLILQHTSATAVTSVRDLSYAAPCGHKHQLDVFTPAGASGLPVLMFVHGGGLEEGDRTEYRWLGRALAEQQYVVVIPSYRLYPVAKAADAVADVAAAFGWTVKHIARFGGSPNRIVLVGHSAGGYLTAILAFDPRYLRAARLSVRNIRGVFELSADYSNRDPDPGETLADIALDHRIYGMTAEERDANSVYRYLHRTVPFEATCESIHPGTQCIDRDHFVALLRGYNSPVSSFTEAHATHDELVQRVAQPGAALNAELHRFVKRVAG
ncbi:MAG: alpha/beta fold hydrolase [Candidatus Eremiobacteraeota bacterium]|nr:alpha/beta fold hydrolase [Candidatus Eremiobacteraeota bacterium]